MNEPLELGNVFLQLVMAFASIVTALVAAYALSIWRRQFVLTRNHELAAKIMREVLVVREAVRRVRDSGDEPGAWLDNPDRDPRFSLPALEALVLEAEVIWDEDLVGALCDFRDRLAGLVRRLVAKAIMLERHKDTMSRPQLEEAYELLWSALEGDIGEELERDFEAVVGEWSGLLRAHLQLGRESY